MKIRSLGLVLLVCASLACAQVAFAQSKKQPGTTAKSRLAVEEAEIRKVDQEFASALAAHDINKVSALLAPDMVSLTHKRDVKKVEGVESARSLTQQYFRETPNLKMKATPERVVVSNSGDMAYLLGDYQATFDGPNGRRADNGRYLFVLLKIDGKWKIAVHGGVAGIWD